MTSSDESGMADLERNDSRHFLMNHSVHNFSWSGLTVTVKDRHTRQSRNLINDVSGDALQGGLKQLPITPLARLWSVLMYGQESWWH